MKHRLKKLNQLELRVEDIQYLPHHQCPRCGSEPITTKNCAWVKPYQDWYNTPLSYWLDHLGYVQFQCDCRHHTRFSGSLRIACLGDAIIHLYFDDGTVARKAGVEPAWVNTGRVRQAVKFLGEHADPAHTAGSDWLAHTLYALAAGGISPEAALRELRQWKDDQIELALRKSQTFAPIHDLVDHNLVTA